MGKKSVYCSDEEEIIFEKAKVLSGGSISPLINKLLREFVQESEYRLAGMDEISLFIGSQNSIVNQMDGERVKFVGKFIASDKVHIGQNDDMKIFLYYTKKGKFLEYTETDDGFELVSKYKVHETLSDLYSAGLPSSLVIAAEKICPEVPCKVLDI